MPNILKKIFWDPKRAFVGVPAVVQMGKKIVLAPIAVFGSLMTVEYILTPSTYYDEYDGTASEYPK